MIGDAWFFLKAVIITFILLSVLQVKVGEETLEEKALTFVHSSSYAKPIQEVSQGAVTFITQIWRKATHSLSSKYMKNFSDKEAAGRRALRFQVERSEKFLKEKARQLREAENQHPVDEYTPVQGH